MRTSTRQLQFKQKDNLVNLLGYFGITFFFVTGLIWLGIAYWLAR